MLLLAELFRCRHCPALTVPAVLAGKGHQSLQAAGALGSQRPFASLLAPHLHPCTWVPPFPAGRRGDMSPPQPLGQVSEVMFIHFQLPRQGSGQKPPAESFWHCRDSQFRRDVHGRNQASHSGCLLKDVQTDHSAAINLPPAGSRPIDRLNSSSLLVAAAKQHLLLPCLLGSRRSGGHSSRCSKRLCSPRGASCFASPGSPLPPSSLSACSHVPFCHQMAQSSSSS